MRCPCALFVVLDAAALELKQASHVFPVFESIAVPGRIRRAPQDVEDLACVLLCDCSTSSILYSQEAATATAVKAGEGAAPPPSPAAAPALAAAVAAAAAAASDTSQAGAPAPATAAALPTEGTNERAGLQEMGETSSDSGDDDDDGGD